ncbi:baseplate J/gp47 family protein [Bradyrhizobium sp.]|uniref:baseplate J/gp47 family protein n=1 Tax=Bradyrhizobium sp. TaxID=376 RepID=UPI001EB25ABE|nr:baseplate J/gp47 family protein [Bradyrhizobium sp.]MBV9981131.1 baseplate J/gp47 family protein [Bradyrhizobium sp.]
MTDYGVTQAGFVVKPFADILSAKLNLARSLFGADVDLRSTSALRKILDIASAEDGEHWKALEGAFYANFLSTASGGALDMLGDDVGLSRDNQLATGQVTFTLANEAPGRSYIIPVGALVETAAPAVRFRTTGIATLSGQSKTVTVAARAVLPGPSGNIANSAITQINPIYAGHYLSLGSATVAATNAAPFAGGDVLADDETYRARLLRLPRTLFTVDAVSAAVLNVDGVRDCKVSDPLGGVDVSLSIFNSFVFDSRRFGQARFLGTPYFFDVLVAPQPGYAWETIGGVVGLRDAVSAAVDAVRPIGIFPNIRLADIVVVGVRANVLTQPGADPAAVTAALQSKFENRVGSLGLGGPVLASEVLSDLFNVSGVVDIQNLHLRRYPPTFGSIVFGDREQFQGAAIEADIGANLPITSNEIATFRYDSQLINLTVSDR